MRPSYRQQVADVDVQPRAVRHEAEIASRRRTAVVRAVVALQTVGAQAHLEHALDALFDPHHEELAAVVQAVGAQAHVTLDGCARAGVLLGKVHRVPDRVALPERRLEVEHERFKGLDPVDLELRVGRLL